MIKKKKGNWLPVILFGGVIVLVTITLILLNNQREKRLLSSGEVTSQDEIVRVTAEEAYLAQTSGQAVLVDTRSPSQFQASHIPGAINIPVSDDVSVFASLDPEIWYITYCT